MTDWLVTAAVIWMFLVASVVFVALGRISAATRDHELLRAGAGANDPLHLRLRHLIQSEDRIGIALTITAVVWSALLARMLVRPLFF